MLETCKKKKKTPRNLETRKIVNAKICMTKLETRKTQKSGRTWRSWKLKNLETWKFRKDDEAQKILNRGVCDTSDTWQLGNLENRTEIQNRSTGVEAKNPRKLETQKIWQRQKLWNLETKTSTKKWWSWKLWNSKTLKSRKMDKFWNISEILGGGDSGMQKRWCAETRMPVHCNAKSTSPRKGSPTLQKWFLRNHTMTFRDLWSRKELYDWTGTYFAVGELTSTTMRSRTRGSVTAAW